MDIGKQSSCLTVTTGEWVCPQRKPLGKRLGSIRTRRRTRTDTDEIATPGRTDNGAHYDEWMADVTTALAPTLTAADRCDRCGARAYVRARLNSGGELLFCAHHGREHLPKLQGLSTNIQDETDRLTPAPVGVEAN
jgi:hypothetical protein